MNEAIANRKGGENEGPFNCRTCTLCVVQVRREIEGCGTDNSATGRPQPGTTRARDEAQIQNGNNTAEPYTWPACAAQPEGAMYACSHLDVKRPPIGAYKMSISCAIDGHKTS